MFNCYFELSTNELQNYSFWDYKKNLLFSAVLGDKDRIRNDRKHPGQN
jgi:hypothetical protein